MFMLDRGKNNVEKGNVNVLKSDHLTQNKQLKTGDIGCNQQDYECPTTTQNLIDLNPVKVRKDQNLKIVATPKPKAIPEIMRGLKITKNRDSGIVRYNFTQSYGNVCGCQACHQKTPLVCTFCTPDSDTLILCDKNSHRLNQARLLEVKNYIKAFAGQDILDRILLDERVMKR